MCNLDKVLIGAPIEGCGVWFRLIRVLWSTTILTV
jgi:hypothetical protein